MNHRQSDLAERRDRLLARSAELRDRIAGQGADLRSSVESIDKGIGVVRALTTRPLVLTAAAAALFILKPARAFKWIARGALVTSLLRRVVKAAHQGQPQPPERFGA
ncbi:MAG: YqjK family protein [Pseudomonadota bacterium]